MTIEAESAEMSYSPFHMLASSLAVCIFSVLASWASHAKLSPEALRIEVGWTFAEQPHRVGSLDIQVAWPGLPDTRRRAVERAAHLCPIHGTLTHPPQITVGFA